VHPILFRLGPGLNIYSYGALLLVALGTSILLCVSLGAKDRVPVGSFILASIGGGYVGQYTLRTLDQMTRDIGDDPLLAGISGYGAVLGGVLGCVAVAHFNKLRFWAFADVAAPALALTPAILRTGCYLFGCDFGVPLGPSAPDWLRALGTFPRWSDGAIEGSPALVTQIHAGLLPPDATSSLPVHPTQIYEVAAGLALFGALLALRSRRRFRGELFLVFLMGHAATRFFIDFLLHARGPDRVGPISSAQLIAAAVAVAAGLVYRQFADFSAKNPAAAMAIEAAAPRGLEPDAAPSKKKRRRPKKRAP
jgi:phosphatidylglycerol---prolipoprotein diacylglyceryl transferase